MKQVVAAFGVALMAIGAWADDSKTEPRRPIKVLMIGNSFSRSVLRETPALVKAAGLSLDIVQCGIGGCPLDRHWANVEKAGDKSFKPYSIEWSYASEPRKVLPKKANVTDMLIADRWNVVTIQQASDKSPFYETYQPYADNMIAKIRELAPQAEIVIQETWSYSPYDGRRMAGWKMNPTSMHAALKSAYAQLAKKHGLRVIPTGDAAQLFRERLPVDYGTLLTKKEIAMIKRPELIDFHGDVVGSSSWKQGLEGSQKDWREIKLRGDFSHFNSRGNYLQACVWAGFLFNVDPTTFTYRPSAIPDADAKLMRECARDAIRKWQEGTPVRADISK